MISEAKTKILPTEAKIINEAFGISLLSVANIKKIMLSTVFF